MSTESDTLPVPEDEETQSLSSKVGGKKEKTRKAPEPDIPNIRVRSKGRINGMLEHLGEMFRKNNPGWDCRWVYSPSHRPELTNVIARKAEGYQDVYAKELGIEVPGIHADEVVRVGDVILMKLPAEEREAKKQELAEAAQDAAKSVDRRFYESIEEISTPGMTEEHRPRPRGRSVIEERDHHYEVDQK